MFLDIHRHSSNKGTADRVLRNLYHSETEQIQLTEFCSFGLHPWHVKSNTLNMDLETIKLASQNNKVIAIGETGIDKAIDADLNLQRKAFREQIEIARKNNLPIIIHCVKAYDEIQSLRKNSKHKNPWIMHRFNASKQTGLDLIKKNCYLSFGHKLLNNSDKTSKVFSEMPLESIFLETDDSDASISEIYTNAAGIKGISTKELQDQIKTNFNTCFEIEL